MNRQVCTVKGMSTAKLEGSVRERLLAAATELFYAEGVHTVGIDRIIERAGVAKASLYSTFGSKDELVRAYLQDRHRARQERIYERMSRHHDPRAKILSVFTYLGERAGEDGFRGCAFVNATAEGPRETPSHQVCVDSRAWLRGVFTDLAREGGAPNPTTLGRQIALLYDGAMTTAQMEHDPSAVQVARDLAAKLIDAAFFAGLRRKPRRRNDAPLP
jgi:AcrR family transcriptional regulator